MFMIVRFSSVCSIVFVFEFSAVVTLLYDMTIQIGKCLMTCVFVSWFAVVFFLFRL